MNPLVLSAGAGLFAAFLPPFDFMSGLCLFCAGMNLGMWLKERESV